jgi:hypothetical protein
MTAPAILSFDYNGGNLKGALMTKRLFLAVPVLITIATGIATLGGPPLQVKAPHFLPNDEIALPEDYREWIFVSSGLGMSYSEEGQSRAENPRFDNVFVKPESYRAFMKTGKWPNGTMFVMEVRRSKTKDSINNTGSFQEELLGIEAEVKDAARFSSGWGFYAFTTATKSGKLLPAATTECQSCHSQHGAVENTFVQFYPTLFEVAKKKGTVKDKY